MPYNSPTSMQLLSHDDDETNPSKHSICSVNQLRVVDCRVWHRELQGPHLVCDQIIKLL